MINTVENDNIYITSPGIQHDNKFDLPAILELIHSNNALDVLVKLFSILSTYLMAKDADTHAVIRCNYIYEKINKVLSKSPQRKAAVGLNFLSALLYRDEENSRGRSLALYSKNMIRVSGCLATMCDWFTRCMIYQDTWRALCWCLAEVCRGVEANQTYCTHLVPVCLKRCSQRNVDAFPVLTSLLPNHNRNIQLFIDSNGISLFTREFLLYDTCLELLAMLVQSSSQVAILVTKSDINNHLRDFLRLHGSNSQLGQWATIILYYTSRLDEISVKVMENEIEKIQTLNKPVPNIHSNGDDTAMLFQNVVNEILHWQPKGDLRDMKKCFAHDVFKKQEEDNFELSSRDANDKTRRSALLKPHVVLQNNNLTSKTKHIKNHTLKDLSFSFLQKQNIRTNSDYSHVGAFNNISINPTKIKASQKNATTQTDSNLMISSDFNGLRTEAEDLQGSDVNYFQPVFVSTPKRSDSQSLLRQRKLSITKTESRSFEESIKHSEKQRLRSKNKIIKRKPNQDKSVHDKNRSISTRFFEAINESCTTLVKTVKNIFVSKTKPENNIQLSKTSHTMAAETTISCNYSFTNYMYKRDAVLYNQKSKYLKGRSGSFEMTNSCNSCNDTLLLKRKLANDDYLKQTVKKLKIGINLYGCDFKKISRTMWPQETYMRPAVLYHLYRKLILK